jgi:hypothetical protein
VERANRTHTEEFYEVYSTSFTVADLNPELRDWEFIYNCVRPHQSLGQKTPLEFLQEYGIIKADYTPYESHMWWTRTLYCYYLLLNYLAITI